MNANEWINEPRHVKTVYTICEQRRRRSACASAPRRQVFSWRGSDKLTENLRKHKHSTKMKNMTSQSGNCDRNEPPHTIMALFVLRKLILQTRMPSYPVGLDVWLLVWHFVYFHTSCVRTAKGLARLRGCAGSPELSLVAYVISTIISWACSNGEWN